MHSVRHPNTRVVSIGPILRQGSTDLITSIMYHAV